MKLMISCWTYEDSLSHDPFFNMPPGFYMKDYSRGIVPDYPLLLLFDEYVGSRESFRLVHENEVYKEVAELWDALLADGRLTLQDYGAAAASEKATIEQSVRYDLRNIDSWFPAFRESVTEWRHFLATATSTLRKKRAETGLSPSEEGLMACVRRKNTRDFMVPKDTEWNVEQVFGGWRRRIDKDIRTDVLYIAEQYFRYVATNIVVSQKLGASLHDWADVAPLYHLKLKIGLQDSPAESEATHVRQLFRVMFPEFRPKSVRAFVRALSDPSVKNLRALVKDASNEKIVFDQAFANETIRRLFESERRLAVQRQVTGWLSLPIHFVPVVGTVAQKVIEEGVVRFLETKARRHAPWFYLISSISKTRPSAPC